MKNTTQQISEVLTADSFASLHKLKEVVKNNEWDTIEHQEITFDEAFAEMEKIKNEIQAAIKEKNNYFENITSSQERTGILNLLNNINSYVTNINAGTNQVGAFIQHVDQLKEKTYKLDLRIKGYPNYQEKSRQITLLKTKYEELITKLDAAEEIKTKAEEVLTSVQEVREKATSFLSDIETNGNQSDTLKDNIEKRNGEVETLYKNVVGYEAEAKQNKEAILDFFKEIDDYEEKIKTSIEKLEETIKTSKTTMDNNISECNDKTDKIITKNQNLQERIYKLLGKSIGANLFGSFKNKRNWMRGQAVAWFILLALSILFLTDSGKYVFAELKPFFENGKITDLSLTFYLRFTLIFPAIYAVYFSAAQFGSTNKLLEEYDFKASVAVVLQEFKDLVEKSKDEAKTQKFLIDAIEKIFQSPTERVFGKKISDKTLNNKAKDLLSDVADLASKVLPKDK